MRLQSRRHRATARPGLSKTSAPRAMSAGQWVPRQAARWLVLSSRASLSRCSLDSGARGRLVPGCRHRPRRRRCHERRSGRNGQAAFAELPGQPLSVRQRLAGWPAVVDMPLACAPHPDGKPLPRSHTFRFTAPVRDLAVLTTHLIRVGHAAIVHLVTTQSATCNYVPKRGATAFLWRSGWAART